MSLLLITNFKLFFHYYFTKHTPFDIVLIHAPVRSLEPLVVSSPSLVSGQGLGGPDSSGETMRIHRENQAKIQAMSQSEILEEQKKLVSQLGTQCFCPHDS